MHVKFPIMLGSCVTFMLRKGETRKKGLLVRHVGVARDLGDDTGRRDRRGFSIALDDGLLVNLASDSKMAVDQGKNMF